MTSPPLQAPSRREQNRAATHEAIAGAALEFLRTRGLRDFTVDDVAAAAGVSRRTFFNYFSSVEAAVASFTRRYLDSVIDELRSRPAEEPVLESARHALTSVEDPTDLAILAEIFSLTKDPQLARFQLQAWEDSSERISEVLRSRLPADTSDLYRQVLAGAVVGSCRAAFQVWFRERGVDTSAASLGRLRELLGETVGLLRYGFPT